jgi:hypothetical protein
MAKQVADRTAELEAQARFLQERAERTKELMAELEQLEAVGTAKLTEAEEALRAAEAVLAAERARVKDQLAAFIEQHKDVLGQVRLPGLVTPKTGARKGERAIKDVILEGLRDGLEAAAIVANVKAEFPHANTSNKDVSWYRGQVKSGRIALDGTWHR